MTSPVTEDRYRVLEMLEGTGSEPSFQIVAHLEEPVSKSRARVVRGHSYTPEKTRVAQASLARSLEALDKYEGNVAMACVFYRATKQRVDVDNLVKLVMDAGTQARLWADDSQVTCLTALLEYDPEAPRSVVGFAPHTSSMARGRDSWPVCEACGKSFEAPGRPDAKWCSIACRSFLKEPIACLRCGTMFKRRMTHQKYCANECRIAAMNDASRANGTPKPSCELCGKSLSRHGYARCRSCWLSTAREALGIEEEAA